MLTDLLVFPIVILEAIIVKALLLFVGVSNSVVYMSCLFLLLHLSMTSLMRFQLRNLNDVYLSKIEASAFAAVITAGVTLMAYSVVGLLPMLKIPFFFLKWLPFSNVWMDLFIVSLPAYTSHLVARMVATSLFT